MTESPLHWAQGQRFIHFHASSTQPLAWHWSDIQYAFTEDERQKGKTQDSESSISSLLFLTDDSQLLSRGPLGSPSAHAE